MISLQPRGLLRVFSNIGFWVGPSLGEKMSASRRVCANEYASKLPHQYACFCRKPTASVSTGEPPILADKSGPVS